MSRLCKTLLLLVLLMSVVSLDVSGAKLTAEVTAWNSAVLSGDVFEGAYAAFLNTSHRKGSVSKGDTATLVINGMYGCKVLGLTAWLKSNKSSGAGSLSVSVDGEECLSLSGSFNKWDGSSGYQTSFVPFAAEGEWLVSDGGQIVLQLVSSANSLHLEKLVVDYEAAEPVAHCVTYVWQTADGQGSATDCELNPGEGVILSGLSEEGVAQIGDWQLAGWTTTPLDGGTTFDMPPAYTPVFNRYHALRDITLYPVYRYVLDVPEIRQAIDRRDGEYVIAREWIDGFCMMTGGVSGNYVSSTALACLCRNMCLLNPVISCSSGRTASAFFTPHPKHVSAIRAHVSPPMARSGLCVNTTTTRFASTMIYREIRWHGHL